MINPFDPASRIFRREALERLETPERLDRLVTFAAPKTWALWAGLLWLGACLLLWAALGP